MTSCAAILFSVLARSFWVTPGKDQRRVSVAWRKGRECEIVRVMAEIQIARKNSDTFEVVVKAARTTSHTVTLKQDYYQKLTGGAVPPERLIEKSFEFLLEREDNTAILSRFELPLIGRYFPEYEKTIVERLRV